MVSKPKQTLTHAPAGASFGELLMYVGVMLVALFVVVYYTLERYPDVKTTGDMTDFLLNVTCCGGTFVLVGVAFLATLAEWFVEIGASKIDTKTLWRTRYTWFTGWVLKIVFVWAVVGVLILMITGKFLA